MEVVFQLQITNYELRMNQMAEEVNEISFFSLFRYLIFYTPYPPS